MTISADQLNDAHQLTRHLAGLRQAHYEDVCRAMDQVRAKAYTWEEFCAYVHNSYEAYSPPPSKMAQLEVDMKWYEKNKRKAHANRAAAQAYRLRQGLKVENTNVRALQQPYAPAPQPYTEELGFDAMEEIAKDPALAKIMEERAAKHQAEDAARALAMPTPTPPPAATLSSQLPLDPDAHGGISGDGVFDLTPAIKPQPIVEKDGIVTGLGFL